MQPMTWFNMHPGGSIFFSFGGREGAGGGGDNFFGILVFPPCPQSVPCRFPNPFFPLLGEKMWRGQFFWILMFPPCPRSVSQRFSQHFPSLMCYPKMFPIAPNLIHSFFPKVEISLSWAKGKHPYTSILRSAQCFQKKYWANQSGSLPKKPYKKDFVCKRPQVTNTTHNR